MEYQKTTLSNQHKINISIKAKGKKRSEEGKENIKKAQQARRKREFDLKHQKSNNQGESQSPQSI